MARKGGETSVSFSTLSTLGTTNSLLFSVEIILMPYDEIIQQTCTFKYSEKRIF